MSNGKNLEYKNSLEQLFFLERTTQKNNQKAYGAMLYEPVSFVFLLFRRETVNFRGFGRFEGQILVS